MIEFKQHQIANDKWVSKIWGRTCECISNTSYSLHLLETITNSYCSLHYHRFRSNYFYVVSGLVMLLEIYDNTIKKTILGVGASYEIRSSIPHMFVVLDGGIMLEEYFADTGDVDNNDIIRLVPGGVFSDVKQFINIMVSFTDVR